MSWADYELGFDSVQRLVPGSVQQLDTTIEALVAVGVPATGVGDMLPKLDEQAWTGAAADAFHAVYAPQPPVWQALGTGLTEMADALKAWRNAVQHGQAEVSLAQQEWHEAKAMTDSAQAAYDQLSQAHDDATLRASMGFGPPPPPLPPFDDLGASLRLQAEQRLADAQLAVAEAEATTISALGRARDALPQPPSALRRFADDVFDDTHTLHTQVSDVGQGAGEAIAGFVNTFRTINPMDPQNQTNPAQYAQRLEAMGTGIVNDLVHPSDAIQSMADNAGHTLMHDPGRLVGSLLPNLAIGAVTDGAGDIAAEAAETAGTGVDEAAAVAASGDNTDAASAAADDGIGEPPAPSTARTTPWGSWSTGHIDAEAARRIADAGAGLGQVERDLAGVHVSGEPSGPTTAPPDAPSAGHPEIIDRLAGAGANRPVTGSTAASTPWGNFAGADLARADADAAAGIADAGAGLGQVERDLGRFHLHPQAPSDPSFSGQLVPGYVDNPDYRIGDLNRQAYQAKWPTTEEDRTWLSHIRWSWPPATRLFDQELLALERFTTPDGPIINSALRTGDDRVLADLDPEIRNLVSALNKLPDYRGAAVREVTVEPTDWGTFLREYEPGATVREPGFTTASRKPLVGGNVRIYIASQYGKDIDPVVPTQSQVVFPAGEVFKVVSREYDSMNGIWKIYVKDLGRP